MFESLEVLDAYDDVVNLIIDYKLSHSEQKELALELLGNICQLTEKEQEAIRALTKRPSFL